MAIRIGRGKAITQECCMTGCGGSPPRDPGVYAWTDHFREDAMQSNFRFFTKEMIAETIAEGRDCDRIEAGAGCLRRRKTFDGVDVVLVLPEDEPVVITGWNEIKSYIEALASDQWSQDDLAKIKSVENLEHKPGPNRDEMIESAEYPNWGDLRLS